MTQPIQPLIAHGNGAFSFKPNAIVEYLLEKGGLNLHDIAEQDFSIEDQEQFAQLIGYSLSGFGGLHCVSSDTYAAAVRMAELGETEEAARIAHLEGELKFLREALQGPMARLFGIHPDNLMPS